MRLTDLSPALRSAGEATRERPAFGLFLAALATLPFTWLAPIGSLHERAGLTDVFLAGAALLWALDRLRAFRAGERLDLEPWHLALGAFLLLGALSAVAADDRREGLVNLVLMAELAVAAVLAADFGSSARNRRAIAVVVMGGALLTAALAALGLGFFYLDVHTRLIDDYGELVPSDRYARVRAGFHKAPLLASYCIFASAVVAMSGNGLPPSWRRLTQWALFATVMVTFSRAVVGFLAALAVRVAAARRTPLRRAAAAATVAAAIAIMACLTFGTLDLDPTQPTDSGFRFSSETVRYRELTTSLDTASDEPLLGIGPGALPGNDLGKPTRAHFTPVNIAATVGYPALAALVLAVGLILWQRRRRLDVAIWAGLLGLAIDGMGQDIDHFRHVWFLLGLAAAAGCDDDGD